MKIALALALMSSAVHAQTAVRPAGPALEASFAAPTPVSLAPGAITLSAASAPTLAPALAASAPAPAAVPTLAPARALAAAPIPAPSSDDRPKPGTPRAADALAKSGAEFARLVSELTGGDKSKSESAALALMKLKDDHLNAAPEAKKTRILDLKPMQIPAGMLEVQEKARALRDMKSKETEAWLKDGSVPVIEDYKGRKRPVDHHHEARAAWEADLDEVYTHRYFDDEMHGRLKALPRDQFYAVTRAMGLFYDRDQFGVGPHDPNHLPEDVRSLADDPYRSVAWQVRKRGGYDKSSIPFAEFKWAQYFRERVQTYPTRADFEKSVLEAMKIVHDPAAKGLPGYKPR
ncbi:MAG: ParB-like protein [Elusimicrobia bacterium]|nr:ParB-like protein [Elusimicrobiota bacterium]